MKETINPELIPLLISKQLTGTLTDEEKEMLEQWRIQNKYNEAVYQRLLNYERLDIEHRRAKLTDYHRPLEDMRKRLGIDGDSRRRPSVKRLYVWSSVAAALLIILGATLFLREQWREHDDTMLAFSPEEIVSGHTQAVLSLSNGKEIHLGEDEKQNAEAIAQVAAETLTQFNTLTTPRGGEFKVELEDGTQVWLNADSRLVYPESFAKNERRVEVSGEAYFEVAYDSIRPFYVVSGGQEIRVYGTEFNVCAYSEEPAIYTTLVKGSISLRPLHGNSGELMLTPGTQAIFTDSTASAQIRPVDTEVITSWRSGVFVFENQTMEQIMRTLSRWYDFEYEFADKEVAATVFMGSIPRYGNFGEVADIFHKMGGIRLKAEGRKVIISED